MEQHNAEVAAISTTIRDFYSRKVPFRIYRGATNSTRPLSFQRDKVVDTSSLSRVLKLDKIKKTILVEPNVPMDMLVAATQPHGLVPPVVMEFPGLTAGGCFCGTGAESSSYRYGYFDRSVSWIEVVLANGDIVTASPKLGDNEDLFWGVAGSYGTLGVTTLLEIRLVDASEWVKLRNLPIGNMKEAIETLEESFKDQKLRYIDGIMFAADRGVIITGEMVSDAGREKDIPIRSFTRASDEWYYIHAENISRKPFSQTTMEYLPLKDYLFRYDRGGFWVGRWAHDYFHLPFNRFTRWVANYFIYARVMFHALHASGDHSSHIIQDIVVPWREAGNFWGFFLETIDKYPIWLCPMKPPPREHTSFHPHILPVSKLPLQQQSSLTDQEEDELLLNFGIWVHGPSSHSAYVEMNRAIERKTFAARGTKWLYAQTFYTQSEFWRIYDRESYDALRKQYHASTLPNVYDKVKTDLAVSARAFDMRSLWPLPGLYALVKSFIGGAYLLPNWKRRGVFGLLVALAILSLIMKFWGS